MSDLQEVANKVAGRYARRVFWADLADLKQEAMVAALRAQKTWDPEVGVPLEAYAWRACVFHLRTYLWRQSAPVSETDRRLGTLRGVHAEELLEDHGEPVADNHQLFEEKCWTEMVQRQVVYLLTKLSTKDARIAVRVVLEEEMPAQVAQDLQLSIHHVYRVARTARRSFEDNAVLHQLWRRR